MVEYRISLKREYVYFSVTRNLRPVLQKSPLLEVRNFLNIEKKQANMLPGVASIIDTLIKNKNDKSYKGGKGKFNFSLLIP